MAGSEVATSGGSTTVVENGSAPAVDEDVASQERAALRSEHNKKLDDIRSEYEKLKERMLDERRRLLDAELAQLQEGSHPELRKAELQAHLDRDRQRVIAARRRNMKLESVRLWLDGERMSAVASCYENYSLRCKRRKDKLKMKRLRIKKLCRDMDKPPPPPSALPEEPLSQRARMWDSSSENKPFIPFVPGGGKDGLDANGSVSLMSMNAMAGLNALPLMPGGVGMPPPLPKRFMHTGPCIIYGLSDRHIESDLRYFRTGGRTRADSHA